MPTKTTVASGVGCPNPAALQGLLDESLKSGDRGLLGAHVGGCARCRGTLAALEAAAVGVTWASLPAAKGPHTAPLHPPATQRLRWQEPPPAARPDVPGYAVLEEIGSGGMGLVFRARHRLLNRVVAIKMLLDGRYASPELRLRFRIEAEAVARLQHPGIVQVFEFGEVEGWP